jgi:AhpC/TSA family
MRRFLFMICAIALLGSHGTVCQTQTSHASYGYYLNGEPVRSLAESSVSAVVLFFAASDCPISNRYLPEIRRLEEEFVAQGVVLWFVYPNFGTTSNAVKQHEAAYGAERHVLLDPDHQLVNLVHAKVTPESAVLVPERRKGDTFRAVYHGRIDDRYLRLGQERPKATQHDLERAIFDVLQGRAVERPNGPAVGCGIIGHP